MRKKKEKEPSFNAEPSFGQQLKMLPETMLRKFLGQMVAAGVIVAMTVFLLLHFQTWQFCIGFLIALYIAYLALDNVWGYQTGKIVCRRMICLKAIRPLLPTSKAQLFVIMQDLDCQENSIEPNIRKFYIATSRKNTLLITPQTVMDIYFNPETPLELVAWEIVGNEGST